MPTLSDYLSLITSEYSDPDLQANYIATVTLAVQPYVDMQAELLGMNRLFDLDVAVGQQLDTTGQWIGLTRYITEPLDIYFSWDIADLGWDQAPWAASYQPNVVTVALDDPHYRILLKARVVANQWDGTIPNAYTAWDTLFAPEGYHILIQDGLPNQIPFFTWDATGLGWDEAEWVPLNYLPYFKWDTEADGWDQQDWFDPSFLGKPDTQLHVAGDMSIIYGLIAPAGVTSIDPITKALFTGGYLNVISAGVMVRDYATQSVIGKPMFAFDCGPDDTTATAPPVYVGGWDVGAWAYMTPGV